MTRNEARELFLNSDCSYFIMCTKYYSKYLEYCQLELPKSLEQVWRNEKIQMLSMEIRRKRDYRLFIRLCDMAVEFRDYEKLRIVLNALRFVNPPTAMDQRLCMAETILGRKALKNRSGLIYWAYDNGQLAIAIMLMDQALQYLGGSEEMDKEMEKRVRRGVRVSKRMIEELDLGFSKRDLRFYYGVH